MTAQLATDGTEVKVCTDCGMARSEGEGFYPLQNERCAECRIQSGEELAECDGCETEDFTADMYEEAFFLSPFDEEESKTGFTYCRSCLDQGEDNVDGTQFYCDGCYRDIASDNGHMTHYRILNECETVCLQCIETDLKAGGVAAIGDDDLLDRMFAGQSTFGMFFDVGELEAEGWTPDPLYTDYHIDGGLSLLKLGARAHGWHKSGRAFIIGYERLSIMGDKGCVTLFTKEAS